MMLCCTCLAADILRSAFLTMSKYASAGASPIAYTTPSFFSKTHRILCMESRSEYGPEQMKSGPKLYEICGKELSPTITTPLTTLIGSRIASASSQGTLCTTFLEITCAVCGFIGTRRRISSMQRRFRAYSASQRQGLTTWSEST